MSQFYFFRIAAIIFICLLGFAPNTYSQQEISKEAKKIIKEAEKYMEDGLFFNALEQYKKVIEIHPDFLFPRFEAVVCYAKIKEADKALDHIEFIEKTDPAYHPGLFYLKALALHGNNEFDKAIPLYQRTLTTLKTNSIPQDQKEQLELLVEMLAIQLESAAMAGTAVFNGKGEMYSYIEKRIKECEYGVEMLENQAMAHITNAGKFLNTKYDEYVPVISADESVMYFTSRRPGSVGGKLTESGLYFEDVYKAEQVERKWSKVKNVGTPINDKEHNATVALNPQGDMLFTYKNDNAGDLYVSYLDGELWTRPDDLGKNINTDYSELSVSITTDRQTIYFSSNRPGGLGGFDIYKSNWDARKKRWDEAINLGPTINTPYDEDAPFIHPDGVTLYFSSKGHKGIGGYDIYMTELENNRWTTPTNLRYPINTAKDDIYFVLSADNKHGYYASSKAGGFGGKDIYRIGMGKVNLDATRRSEQTKLAANKNKLTISKRPEIKVARVEPTKQNEPKSILTILKGKTYDEITQKPISAKLIITDNQTKEILFEEKSNATTGAYMIVIPNGKNYGIRAEKEEYLFNSVNVNVPQADGYQEIVQDLALKPIKIGSIVRLNNIFFDYDKATLRPESEVELKRLISLLNEYPNLYIEIGGHTDSRGADDYNLDLSDRRAASVVTYLVEHGINSERLSSKGYGEKNPIATNETEEGMQLNRRTEFKVLKN